MPTNETSQTISYLNNTFRKAIGALRLSSSSKNTSDKIKGYEIEFAYLIDDIERGHEHFVAKRISDANALISEVDALGDLNRTNNL